MKKVIAVLVLTLMAAGSAQAQNYGYANRGYANPGYNNGYKNNYRNNGYNYAGAAIAGAVIGAVAAGVISQSYAQPIPQPVFVPTARPPVCWQEPATVYVPNQYYPNQVVPVTTINTVCR